MYGSARRLFSAVGYGILLTECRSSTHERYYAKLATDFGLFIRSKRRAQIPIIATMLFENQDLGIRGLALRRATAN